MCSAPWTADLHKVRECPRGTFLCPIEAAIQHQHSTQSMLAEQMNHNLLTTCPSAL